MNATNYAAFLETKGPKVEAAGFEPGPLHESLYPFQRDIVAWAVRRGRAAVFADCGMGKTRMQVEWARQVSNHSEGAVLIVAPLAVAEQTIAEARELGLVVERVNAPMTWDNCPPGRALPRYQITNYERLHHFVGAPYAGIVLDESSILKSLDGKTRTLLIKEFSAIPYRLCCTATPAPNDVSEMGNHAEFLGAMSRVEMLATFFVHDSDDGTWRLKGHAAASMWQWASAWACFVRRPSDLGYPDGGWELPPLRFHESIVPTGLTGGLSGLAIRSQVRRATLEARISRAVEIVECPGRTEKNSGTTSGGTTGPTANGTQSGIGSGKLSAAPTIDGSSGTASPAKNTTSAGSTNPASARSADSSLSGSASITATGPERSAASPVASAIRGSGTSSTTPSLSSPLGCTSSDEQWVIWCGLNDEEDALAAALGDRCVVVNGKDSEKSRLEKLAMWRSGERPILVSKAKIFGWGVNMQHCSRMMFFGIGDSFELFYQAVRRCWRFGQVRPVDVHLVVSDVEGSILENVKRKEQEAAHMAESIVAAVRDTQQGIVRTERHDAYEPKTEATDNWALMLGDCVERIKEVPDKSVGLSVFSPPFASLYTYSSSTRDLGNCRNFEEFFKHFSFLIPELLRVTMPGRRAAVHCQQLSTTKATHGHIGLRDFRGELIRAFEKGGWYYDGEICIDKNPQAQAIRTKSKQLMFVQKNKDSSWNRPALADYVLLFRHPEENPETPVKTDVTNEEWILFAHPVWYGIRESNVLRSYRDAREDEDEKHICPLQLETIERCIRLWSNPGDVILSPFAGIGSEGYVARRFGRSFIGIELKESYWTQAVENLKQADAEGIQKPTEAVGLAELIERQKAKSA